MIVSIAVGVSCQIVLVVVVWLLVEGQIGLARLPFLAGLHYHRRHQA